MENQLIKVTVQNDQQLVSARELHKGLGLTTRFSKWVEQNFKDFDLGSDFMSVTTVTDMPNGGTKPIQDYALTIDMAKQLCLLSRTKRGKEYREYLIEIEKKWNDPQNVVQRAMDILHSENLQLKLENEQMKPKALFADAVAASKTDILIGQLAKMLRQNGYEIGQNRLFKWLREHHYLCSKGAKYNQPTQRAMDLGLFRIKERTINNPDGSTRITVTTLVTGKGQQYFVNRFLNSEPNQLTLEIESA